jgi:hypothetical protein
MNREHSMRSLKFGLLFLWIIYLFTHSRSDLYFPLSENNRAAKKHNLLPTCIADWPNTGNERVRRCGRGGCGHPGAVVPMQRLAYEPSLAPRWWHGLAPPSPGPSHLTSAPRHGCLTSFATEAGKQTSRVSTCTTRPVLRVSNVQSNHRDRQCPIAARRNALKASTSLQQCC